MKKLIAMIGAVAMSFGLFAATPFSISFEQAESEKGVDTEAMTFTPGTGWNDWAGGALAIKGYEDGEVLPYGDAPNDRRDAAFDGAKNNDNYLPLETGKNTLTRDVGEGNIYLDQLVKFTGFEEMQTEFAAGTKIAVWKASIADDDDAITNANLYVTVGQVDLAGEVTPVTLKLDGTYADDTWYRLTIKSLGDIFEGKSGTTPRAGFVIYIDGQQVACSEDVAKNLIEDVDSMSATAKSYMLAGKLFTSMTADAAFAKVGYMGIGAIDDVILDAEGPLFAQVVDFDVTVPANFAVSVVSNLTKGVAITADPTSGKYSAGNGEQIGITVVAAGPVVMDPTEITKPAANGTLEVTADDLEGKYEPADVSLTRDTETTYFTQDGFEALLLTKGAVVDGDVITVLKEMMKIGEQGFDYSFTPGTTIAIADVKDATDAVIACKWTVNVPNYVLDEEPYAGTLTFNLGIEPEKQIEVTFTAAEVTEDNTFSFSGAIAGQGAYLKVNNGTADLSDVKLVGDAKVYVKGRLTVEDVFTNADEIKEEQEGGFWVYSVQQATGFAIIIAEGNIKYYPTLQDAINAAENGQTVTIMAPATFDHYVEVADKEITLDLNGNTLTYIGATDPHCAICIHNGAGLTVDDSTEGKAGVLDGGDCLGAIQLTFKDDDSTNPAKLTVEAGKIVGKSYAVSGNGNRPNTEVVINGGWLLGTAVDDSAGIYNPQRGSLTINGGRVEGATGVYIKAGDVDCSITSTAEIVAVGSKRDHKDVGSFESTGDAIVVDNAGYPGGEPTVDIAGGKFESANASAVASYAKTGLEPIAGFISGGQFKGATLVSDDLVVEGMILPQVAGQWSTPKAGYWYAQLSDGTKFETLAAAIAAAAENDTVTLLKDLELKTKADMIKFPAGFKGTFNLGGKTIERTASNDYVIQVETGADLTIAGEGLVKFEPVKLGYTTSTYAKITGLGTPSSMIDVANNGALTIAGGTFQTDYCCVKTEEFGELSITGGALEILPITWGGLTFTVMNWGVAEITGGDFDGNVQVCAYTDKGVPYAGNLTIAGGTFQPATVYLLSYNNDAFPVARVENTIAATFTDPVYVDYGAGDGIEATTTAGATYTTYTLAAIPQVQVARINDKTYGSLGAACAALTGGETIELLVNYTAVEGEEITFNANATLDLGGFTLTVPEVVLSTQTFKVAAEKEVTLTNGTILMPEQAGNRAISVYGTVNVACTIVRSGTSAGAVFDVCDGATVNCGDDADLTGDGLVFWFKKSGARTINITGGKYYSKSASGCYSIFYGSYDDCNDVLNITAGEFKTGGNTILYTKNESHKIACTLDETCTAVFTSLGGEIAKYIADDCVAAKVGGDGEFKDYYHVVKAWDVTLMNGEVTVDTQVVADGACATNVTLAVDGFKGWTNATYTAGFDFETPIEADLTLYAWIEAAPAPVDPEWPTKPYDTDDQAQKAADAMNDGDHVKTSSINVPAEAGTTDAEKDAYAALFVAVAKADKTVVVELNADGTNTLAKSAEKVVEKATGLGDSTATAVTITPAAADIVPGFYYGLGASTEVAGEKVVTSWQQATTEGLKEPLTANKPENSTKGFFQVRVSVRQQN